MNLPLVSPAEIQRQLKKLGTDWKASRSNLIYATQRQLIPQPVEGNRGGKSIKAMRPGETGPELQANRELARAKVEGGGGLSLEQIRIVRELGRALYEGVMNLTPENSARTFARLSELFEKKEFYAVPVSYWLYVRREALLNLYGAAADDGHALWSNSPLVIDFATYLSRGLMRSATWNGKRLLLTSAAAQPTTEADQRYLTACAERATQCLTAKALN
jgi:hypothetical protein